MFIYLVWCSFHYGYEVMKLKDTKSGAGKSLHKLRSNHNKHQGEGFGVN